MNEKSILDKVQSISRETLSTVKKTNRKTAIQLVMASDEIDIYIGLKTAKFYACVDSQFYVII